MPKNPKPRKVRVTFTAMVWPPMDRPRYSQREIAAEIRHELRGAWIIHTPRNIQIEEMEND